MIKGIIFDMDGVLVLGANEFHIEAWKRAFQEYNIPAELFTVDEYARLEGMKGEEIQQLILQRNCLSLQDDLQESIYKRKKEIFKEIDNPYTPQEIKDLIKDLDKKGYRLIIASGNNRIVIETFLKKQELEDTFHDTITGDEVRKGKPDPEVFLKALEKMGLPKEEVIIVENAPLGVRAAKAAGIYTVAITSTVSKDELSEADEIISSLTQLPGVLG